MVRTIGAHNATMDRAPFRAWLDGIRIYRRVLTVTNSGGSTIRLASAWLPGSFDLQVRIGVGDRIDDLDANLFLDGFHAADGIEIDLWIFDHVARRKRIVLAVFLAIKQCYHIVARY